MKNGKFSLFSIFISLFSFLSILLIADRASAAACGSRTFNGEEVAIAKCVTAQNEQQALSACSTYSSFWYLGGNNWGCSTQPSMKRQCAQLGGVNAEMTRCNQQPQAASATAVTRTTSTPYMGTEGASCIVGDGTRGCNSGLVCTSSGGTSPHYSCEVEKASSGATSTQADVGTIAKGCNSVKPQNLDCCRERNGQWLRNEEDAGGWYCEFGSSPSEQPQLTSELNALSAKGLICSKAADDAAEECNQETNAQAQKSKQESTAALSTLRQMGQASGSTSLFIKAANLTAGVELALGAMRLSCESKGEECVKKCDEAKTGAEEIRPKLLNPAEKNKGDAIISAIEKGYKKCGEYKGALNSLLNDINKNALARMQALIAGGCSSNSMPADLQYCCTQPVPATCYTDPRIANPDPNLTWTPTTPSTIAPPTTTVCTGTNCQVATKATDVRGTASADFGRGTGAASGGSGSGGLPNFNFGSDGTATSSGGNQKPTDLAPPAPGGGGGGFGGGGIGGGGGGVGSGSGGGEHSGGSGDNLFDGMRTVGGSDPNRLGVMVSSSPGGNNSLSLNGGKAAALAGKPGADTVPLGRPDFSQFERGKGTLGIRGMTGATGPDGLTGPDTNIWKKINNGYVNDLIFATENAKKK